MFVLHNYFDGPTKLFSDVYLIIFLNTSAKSFFLCNVVPEQKLLNASSIACDNGSLAKRRRIKDEKRRSIKER